MHYLFFILIGILGGIIGGTFGVGGGIIVVPALVLGFGFAQHLAQGTMLATLLLPSFAIAVWTYHKVGNINWLAAVLISVGMALGSVVGASYAQSLPAPILKRMFGVLMVLGGLKLILWK